MNRSKPFKVTPLDGNNRKVTEAILCTLENFEEVHRFMGFTDYEIECIRYLFEEDLPTGWKELDRLTILIFKYFYFSNIGKFIAYDEDEDTHVGISEEDFYKQYTWDGKE